MKKELKSIKEKLKEELLCREYIQLFITSELSDGNLGDIKDMLESFYAEKILNLKCFASVLNSIFTQKNRTFLLSKAILESLIKSDPNFKGGKLSSAQYRSFRENVMLSNVFKICRKPTGPLAGVYSLSDPSVLKYLYKLKDKNFFDNQESFVVNCYDKKDKYEDKNIKPKMDEGRIRLAAIRENAKKQGYLKP